MLAKICGLTSPEAVTAALDGGAGFIGFVFFAASPRNIALPAASRLAVPARGKTRIVALLVDPDNALVDQVTTELAPDLIQLHGRESPSRVAEIVARSGVGTIKVIGVREVADLDAARDFEAIVQHLMFEAKPAANASRPGGLGEVFDWDIMAGRRFARPWFLAGGLDPWNVGDAVRRSGAPMVDVSSGVERGPGLKDPALIAGFLSAVRGA